MENEANSNQALPTVLNLPVTQVKLSSVIHRLSSKKYKIPPRNTQPPYYVELPPEEYDSGETSNQVIPNEVEEALSTELSTTLPIKRDREPITLCLTDGNVNERGEPTGKKARIIAEIDGQIFLESIEMVEEADLPMPPKVK